MSASLLLGLLLFQGPGDGWVLAPDTRQVKRLYYELFQTTEIWLRLVPDGPDGKPPLVNVIFQAYFPGRAARDPYTGLPKEPKGPPARLLLVARALPLTMIRDLSLRLTVDGRVVPLTGPGAKHRDFYPCFVGDGCAADGVEAEIDAALLRSLVAAREVRGEALGFPFKLVAEDQRPLAEFAARIGVTGP